MLPHFLPKFDEFNGRFTPKAKNLIIDSKNNARNMHDRRVSPENKEKMT